MMDEKDKKIESQNKELKELNERLVDTNNNLDQ